MGSVFELTIVRWLWSETVIYSFTGPNNGDGAVPGFPGLVLDAAGKNLYGTTDYGGSSSQLGTVFELSNSGSTWKETVLHSLADILSGSDGYYPYGGLVFDAAGNLYGTTQYGGLKFDDGSVFQLQPSEASGLTS